jgi:hypothetical protein
MTDEERAEGAEDAIEDLEAPAAALGDVAGGFCAKPTCLKNTGVQVFCARPTCHDSMADCTEGTGILVVHEV